MSLRDYVQAERGRAVSLAKAVNVHVVLIRQWAAQTRPVPIEHCAALELATGGAVTRQQLRPDDWQRIWPELADQVQAGEGDAQLGEGQPSAPGDDPDGDPSPVTIGAERRERSIELCPDGTGSVALQTRRVA